MVVISSSVPEALPHLRLCQGDFTMEISHRALWWSPEGIWEMLGLEKHFLSASSSRNSILIASEIISLENMKDQKLDFSAQRTGVDSYTLTQETHLFIPVKSNPNVLFVLAKYNTEFIFQWNFAACFMVACGQSRDCKQEKIHCPYTPFWPSILYNEIWILFW